MLPELTLWAIGAEGEGCLYRAHRCLADGSCWRGGGDTGKSRIWSVFTLPPLCPVVLFCPVVFNLTYSDFTQQICTLSIKGQVPGSNLKLFLFGLFLHLNLLFPGHFCVSGFVQSSRFDYHDVSPTPYLKRRNALYKLMT